MVLVRWFHFPLKNSRVFKTKITITSKDNKFQIIINKNNVLVNLTNELNIIMEWYLVINPWTPRSDYHVNSPYSIDTLHSKQVMRTLKLIR